MIQFFHNSALLLGDVIDNLQTIVFDTENYQATRRLIDEEFRLDYSDSFILREGANNLE